VTQQKDVGGIVFHHHNLRGTGMFRAQFNPPIEKHLSHVRCDNRDSVTCRLYGVSRSYQSSLVSVNEEWRFRFAARNNIEAIDGDAGSSVPTFILLALRQQA
jgi:hypothetical protein